MPSHDPLRLYIAENSKKRLGTRQVNNGQVQSFVSQSMEKQRELKKALLISFHLNAGKAGTNL